MAASFNARVGLLVGTALVTACGGGTAFAQETAPPAGAGGDVAQSNAPAPGPVDPASRETQAGGLEEIVVTAQKREQRLQDVPIAVTAITTESIQANRITSVQDLSGLAPNVIVRPAAGGSAIPTFSMRGLTSYGVVPGSDKQVSINLDGVYISATRGALFELPDIARIEVLRGPQGTLFGRNATAGAVSIVSRDPDGKFGGRVELGLGNYDQRRVRATLNSPQWGPFSAYVSFVHNERRGDIRNLGAGTQWDRSGVGTITGVRVVQNGAVTSDTSRFLGRSVDTSVGVLTSPKYLGDKNVETYFAALKFEPSDSISAIYKYDLSVDNSTPEGVGSIVNRSAPAYSLPNGGTILLPILNNQPAVGPYGQVVQTLDGKRPKAVNNYFTVPSYLKNQGHNLTINFNVADGVTIKNIAAYRKSYLRMATSQIGGLGGLVVTQAGLTALGVANVPNFANFPAGVQTAILNGLTSSLTNGRITTGAGLIGARLIDVGTQIQNLSKQYSNETQLNYDSEFVTLTLGGIYFHSNDRSGVAQYTGGTQSLSFLPANGDVPLGRTAVSYNKASSVAGFAQSELHITPKLDVVLGGRLTHDRKSGNFLGGTPAAANGNSTGYYVPNGPGCAASTTAPATTTNPNGACRLSGSYIGLTDSPFTYSDTRFIYSVGANYKPNRDVLVFGKYSTGYVSGGRIADFAFVPETVKSFEAGIKADWFDRRLRTNLALFHAKYMNVQSAQSGRTFNRPDIGTVVVRGFDEKTYGFEFEATAAPIDGLTLGASLGYTHIDQSNYNPLLVGGSQVTGLQTFANTRLVPTGTPKWTSNLNAQYETQPLFGEATLLARIDANWRSRLQNDINPDRGTLVPEYAVLASSPPQWILNGRVALRKLDIGGVSTELAIWGRNLTNNRDILYPLVVQFSAGTSYQAARTFGVDLIANF